MARVDAATVDSRTVAQARRSFAGQLHDAGLESPDLDARILIGQVLGLDHAALTAAGARRLGADEEAAIGALIRRRLAREPVARIIGRKEFWSLPLRIDAATLVPRPETETIVEAALAAIDARGWRARPLRIADLGTGSGALALALSSELPNATIVATDLSLRALAVARDNARHLGFGNISFTVCSMADALQGPFDLIVSNPPYIASGDIAVLAPDVRDFDPRLALDGGRDGLDAYRVIAASAPALLAPGGLLIVELGIGLAEPVTSLLAAAGLAVSPPRPDLNDVPRALAAERRA
jgi:release factor glutamine methyltransferase